MLKVVRLLYLLGCNRGALMNLLRYGVLVAALSSTTSYATAEVTRIEIASRADVQTSKAFGDTGPYEEIVGKVYYSLDPDNTRNKAVVDLDKASRSAAGQVTFSADLYVLAPKDIARGNGVALFDVLNRGRKNILRDFNRAPPSFVPNAALDLGDGFLMRQGYTLVWVGWQFDIPHRGGLMGLEAPPTLDNGKPVSGRISTTFTPNTTDPTYPLDDMGATRIRPAILRSILLVPPIRLLYEMAFSAHRAPFRVMSGNLVVRKTARSFRKSRRSTSKEVFTPAISMN